MEFFSDCLESLRNRTSYLRNRRRRTRRSIRLTSVYGPLWNRNVPFSFAIDRLAAHHLTPESNTTTDDKIEAIASIGHFSWTGGAEVAEHTGRKYMQTFVLLLKDSDTPHSLKLQIVKSLSEICCANKANQDRARDLKLVAVIIDYMDWAEEEEETRKWCLHTLFYLLCDHRENQLQALADPNFNVCVLRGKDDNWEAWEYNEAVELEAMTKPTLSELTLN